MIPFRAVQRLMKIAHEVGRPGSFHCQQGYRRARLQLFRQQFYVIEWGHFGRQDPDTSSNSLDKMSGMEYRSGETGRS